MMVNYNGKLLNEEDLNISIQNRGFKYGDSIFETIKIFKNKVVFWEDHYFRLMASMRMLRMKIPLKFTLEYLEQEILKTVKENNNSDLSRVRLNVFRKDGGLYTPITNEIDYTIQVNSINYITKENYKIDVFKDFYNYSGLLSTVKTNNRMVNTLASIYAKENDLDNCVLINERKGVVEVSNGNIFVLKDNVVKTPSLNEGCIKGIVRKKVIEIISKNDNYILEETTISPFEIQKADEVFITNAIIGIQPVTNYKKKSFKTEFGNKIAKSLNVLEFTSN
ncbi:Aminotransferase class IV [Polaribacter dokdonensis DSW-5]|uniref:branched-chain-amino-acid transaminase n=2 Tax=Polaribacter dokdonensis DSW-5 TaxID=1300348 RepID=A0A0N0UNR6_9FLAO|nr:Aminotransferase class IV [Polaribacter dokdonensis DSW-5]